METKNNNSSLSKCVERELQAHVFQPEKDKSLVAQTVVALQAVRVFEYAFSRKQRELDCKIYDLIPGSEESLAHIEEMKVIGTKARDACLEVECLHHDAIRLKHGAVDEIKRALVQIEYQSHKCSQFEKALVQQIGGKQTQVRPLNLTVAKYLESLCARSAEQKTALEGASHV